MNDRSMPPEQEAELLKSYRSGQNPIRERKRGGCLGGLLKLALVGVFGLAVAYGVILVTDPWSYHIGGRSTPLLTWHGYGQLQTKDGNHYPLYVSFFPSSHSSHSSQLPREGLRPAGGLQGSGWLCSSPGVTEHLDLSGTIYGRWSSTEGSLMSFRLLERNIINLGQRQGFFDLAGRWRGQELVMQERGDHGETGETFRSGLRIDYASVTLNWGSYGEFKRVCARTK